eukprot:GHVU01087337.1.p1 GENE.GHVU01087337.1~~GHVU01087337.1.p1  ORF type:complete len:188 (-),score=32.95 GHVU01087337.1:406-969(-)
MQEGDSTLTTTKFMNAGARPFRFIMGASPQFEMGAQTLALTDILCKRHPQAYDDDGNGDEDGDRVADDSVSVKQSFQIDGNDVKAILKYRFHKTPDNLSDKDVAARISFSSFITCTKSDTAKLRIGYYFPLGSDQTHSAVERSGLPPESSRPDESWYKDLKESFAKRPPPQEMYNFDELWKIDAKFR